MKVFTCPSCGEKSVAIQKTDSEVMVRCSSCNLSETMNYINIYDDVDYFGEFVDRVSTPKTKPTTLEDLTKEGFLEF